MIALSELKWRGRIDRFRHVNKYIVVGHNATDTNKMRSKVDTRRLYDKYGDIVTMSRERKEPACATNPFEFE